MRRFSGEGTRVGAFVTHFVAKYDPEVVRKFVAKLYADPPVLDSFTCTDSIPCVVRWLEEELRLRSTQGGGGARRANVVSLAPQIAEWVRAHPPPSGMCDCLRGSA